MEGRNVGTIKWKSPKQGLTSAKGPIKNNSKYKKRTSIEYSKIQIYITTMSQKQTKSNIPAASYSYNTIINI